MLIGDWFEIDEFVDEGEVMVCDGCKKQIVGPWLYSTQSLEPEEYKSYCLSCGMMVRESPEVVEWKS